MMLDERTDVSLFSHYLEQALLVSPQALIEVIYWRTDSRLDPLPSQLGLVFGYVFSEDTSFTSPPFFYQKELVMALAKIEQEGLVNSSQVAQVTHDAQVAGLPLSLEEVYERITTFHFPVGSTSSSVRLPNFVSFEQAFNWLHRMIDIRSALTVSEGIFLLNNIVKLRLPVSGNVSKNFLMEE